VRVGEHVPSVALAVTLAAGVAVAATPPGTPTGFETGRIARIGWLAGCWSRQDSARTLDEQWMRPAGGLMLGVGRTLTGGRLSEFEFMRIEERGGKLVYTAVPSGQKEASFVESELTDTSVVFANSKHDFPQTIRYRRMSDGSLLAQIEGPSGGRKRVIDYPMQRIGCEASP